MPRVSHTVLTACGHQSGQFSSFYSLQPHEAYSFKTTRRHRVFNRDLKIFVQHLLICSVDFTSQPTCPSEQILQTGSSDASAKPHCFFYTGLSGKILYRAHGCYYLGATGPELLSLASKCEMFRATNSKSKQYKEVDCHSSDGKQ